MKCSGPRTATSRGCVLGLSMSLRWSSGCGDSPRCAIADYRRTPHAHSPPWRWPTSTCAGGICRDSCARKGQKRGLKATRTAQMAGAGGARPEKPCNLVQHGKFGCLVQRSLICGLRCKAHRCRSTMNTATTWDSSRYLRTESSSSRYRTGPSRSCPRSVRAQRCRPGTRPRTSARKTTERSWLSGNKLSVMTVRSWPAWLAARREGSCVHMISRILRYLLGANPCVPTKKRVKLPAVSKPRSKAMSCSLTSRCARLSKPDSILSMFTNSAGDIPVDFLKSRKNWALDRPVAEAIASGLVLTSRSLSMCSTSFLMRASKPNSPRSPAKCSRFCGGEIVSTSQNTAAISNSISLMLGGTCWVRASTTSSRVRASRNVKFSTGRAKNFGCALCAKRRSSSLSH